MFVKSIKNLRGLVLIGAVAVLGATNTAATESSNPTIPVTVNLTGVQIADGPIYISVQKREQYMGMKGHGTVLKTVTPGNMTATVNVTEPGDYSVSVWHDMDDDTVFDMDETYRLLKDGGLLALRQQIGCQLLTMSKLQSSLLEQNSQSPCFIPHRM